MSDCRGADLRFTVNRTDPIHHRECKYEGGEARGVVKREFYMAITHKFVIINEIPPYLNKDCTNTKDGNIL